MCCYILAGEHQGNEWEAAIDDYISGTNLDKQPISIMIEACPVITVNNLRKLKFKRKYIRFRLFYSICSVKSRFCTIRNKLVDSSKKIKLC